MQIHATHPELFSNLNKMFLFFCLIPSWSGVYEETALVVSGSQPADQLQRTEGRLYPASPGLLTQPPGKRGGSGEHGSAPDTGPKSQQPHWGKSSNSWSLKALDLMSLFSVAILLDPYRNCFACLRELRDSRGFIELSSHHSVSILCWCKWFVCRDLGISHGKSGKKTTNFEKTIFFNVNFVPSFVFCI